MIKFKEFVATHEEELKQEMGWENYDLNETTLIVSDLVKGHALKTLSYYYGKFMVEEDILDELKAEIFINFPTLLQHLSISRVMTGEAIVPKDTFKETLTRTESVLRDVEQNNQFIAGTESSQSENIDTVNNTTGTIADMVESTISNSGSTTNTNKVAITNTSGVQETGSRNVNLIHELPEQSINGETNNFTYDEQGSPVLTSSNVQQATQNFSTVNPINSTESSEQDATTTSLDESSSFSQNEALKTHNVSVSDKGIVTRTTSNSGEDKSVNSSLENQDTTITETKESEATNAQYAYEINAFLESTKSTNAFKIWCDKFSWIVGIQ